ncbi:MAG: hypothetical protein ABIJ50_03665 [Pseudomonadota bacterium]
MVKKISVILAMFFITVSLGTAAQAVTMFNPCGLLSKEEAAALVGETVTAPELQETRNPLGQKMCRYTPVSSSRLLQISVIRTADMAAKIVAGGQSAKTIYITTKQMLHPVEQVPGVGDDACWGSPGLHILKGDVYILISVGNTGKAENLALARRIADTILPRI